MNWRKSAGSTVSTRLVTAMACIGLVFLAAITWPASRHPQPTESLAFAADDAVTTVAPAAFTPTPATPVPIAPVTASSISVPTTTTEPPKRPAPSRVLLIGDSIAHEIRIELADILAVKGIALDTVTFPGLAPCDLADPAAETMTANPADLVILLFTGNAISPCMSEANDPAMPEYFTKYRADMTAMVNSLDRDGVDVWVVGPLPHAKPSTTATVAELDEIFRSIDGVEGAIPIFDVFTTADGAFATKLPCTLPNEPCPKVQVRAEDGVHLGDDGTANIFGRKRLVFGIDRFLGRNYE